MQNDRVPKSVLLIANKTLAAVDCGVVQRIGADALVMSLPSTAVGLYFIFEVAGVKAAGANGPAGTGTNKSAGFAISPAAADGITGGGLATPVINKDLLLAKTTSIVGMRIGVMGTGVAGTGAWIVTEIPPTGVTREA
jgi:hypothetical protein